MSSRTNTNIFMETIRLFILLKIDSVRDGFFCIVLLTVSPQGEWIEMILFTMACDVKG